MFFLPLQSQVALGGMLWQRNQLAIEQNKIAREQQRTLQKIEEQNRKIEEQNRDTSPFTPYGEHTFTQNGFCRKCGWERELLVKIKREICDEPNKIGTLEDQNLIAREQQRTRQRIEEQNRATSPYGEHTFTQNGFCKKCGWQRESLVRIKREICPKLALEQKRALNEENRIAREQQRTLQNIEEQNRQTLKRIEAQNIALKSSMRRMAVREAEKRAKKRRLEQKAKIKIKMIKAKKRNLEIKKRKKNSE